MLIIQEQEESLRKKYMKLYLTLEDALSEVYVLNFVKETLEIFICE